VTLFTFGRGLHCDCGAWVDLTVGHQESVQTATPQSEDDQALLAVCRAAYTQVMASLPGNVSAAQLAIAEELRKAGFELDEDNERMTGRLRTILAVLADGRSVQRLRSGEWVILRDSV